MFVRMVTLPLKPGSASEFSKVIENKVIPLLRRHKGFLDEIALVAEDGKSCVGMSLWDSKESAEAYSRSSYGEVLKALEKVVEGRAELKTFQVTNSTAHKVAPARVA